MQSDDNLGRKAFLKDPPINISIIVDYMSHRISMYIYPDLFVLHLISFDV